MIQSRNDLNLSINSLNQKKTKKNLLLTDVKLRIVLSDRSPTNQMFGLRKNELLSKVSNKKTLFSQKLTKKKTYFSTWPECFSLCT